MMPGGGGSLAARRIIVHNPETRIVALSSFDSREISSEMTRAGACAFIAKGCSAADLADAIHAAVGTNAQTTP
jgi:DNA-binding NarL/FixJ family response regulator